MTVQHKRPQDPKQLAKSIIDRVTGQQPSPVDARDPVAAAPVTEELAHATSLTPEQHAEIAKKATQEVTGQNLAEVPNMPQRTVMQCLSLDDWKVVAHLPVPVGELMVSRLLDYGWIESRSEKQGKAIRLTPAGLKALRSRAD
jgi:hypothetical protein